METNVVPRHSNHNSALPDPQKSADALLNQAGQQKPAVDLNSIVALWPDLKVTSESLDGEGYLIDLGTRGGEIIVRGSINRARTRYTIAHELGHWVLRSQQTSNVASCDGSRTRSSAAVEKWCDTFAANLLMPTDWLRAELKAARVSGLAHFLSSGPASYNVSIQAFLLRISEVSRISIYQIKRLGRNITISERYDSPHVERKMLDKALGVFTCMDPQSAPRGSVDDATNFVGLPIPLRDLELGHLLCVFPRR